jgi:hypothetical protein
MQRDLEDYEFILYSENIFIFFMLLVGGGGGVIV